MRLLLGALRQAFPDFKILLERVIAEDALVAAYITVSGTHEGEFFRMPPTGRRFAAPYPELMRIRDDEIVEICIVRDQLAMLQQLGMLPSEGTVTD